MSDTPTVAVAVDYNTKVLEIAYAIAVRALHKPSDAEDAKAQAQLVFELQAIIRNGRP